MSSACVESHFSIDNQIVKKLKIMYRVRESKRTGLFLVDIKCVVKKRRKKDSFWGGYEYYEEEGWAQLNDYGEKINHYSLAGSHSMIGVFDFPVRFKKLKKAEKFIEFQKKDKLVKYYE